MFSKILVPYDKSDHARHALKEAIELVQCAPDAQITVLFVADLPDYSSASFEAAATVAGVTTMSPEDLLEVQKQFYAASKTAIVEDTAEIIKGYEDRVAFRITSGRPHDAIVEYSMMEGNDLIVIGRRGLGAVRGVLGSVSYAVLRSVDIPVLVVK